VVKRRKLVVYYTNSNAVEQLRNVNIYYESKKNDFAILYVDLNNFDSVYNKLKNNQLVKDIKVDEDIFEF